MRQTLHIPGNPVAQGRPKIAVVAGHARAYDPAKSRSWKGYVSTIAQGQMLKEHDGPVAISIDAVFLRPQGIPKWKGTGRFPRGSRPDVDNLAKAVCDALNGIAYHDDSAVTTLIVRKWTAAEGELPHVFIVIDDVEVPRPYAVGRMKDRLSPPGSKVEA